jgi:hypothetical protein
VLASLYTDSSETYIGFENAYSIPTFRHAQGDSSDLQSLLHNRYSSQSKARSPPSIAVNKASFNSKGKNPYIYRTISPKHWSAGKLPDVLRLSNDARVDHSILNKSLGLDLKPKHVLVAIGKPDYCAT